MSDLKKLVSRPRKLGKNIYETSPMYAFKYGGSPRIIPLRLIGSGVARRLEFDVVFEDFENTKPEFDLVIGQAVQAIVFAAPLNMWEIAEFEIFGGGYVPKAQYISDRFFWFR